MAPASTVGFQSPMLSLIADRVKTLDMRPADDPATRSLRVGDVFTGCERSLRILLRVVSVDFFPSVAQAFDHYHGLNQHHLLFPPLASDSLGLPHVESSAAAVELYGLLRRRDSSDLPVRVMGLRPVGDIDPTHSTVPPSVQPPPLREPSPPPTAAGIPSVASSRW